MFGWGPLVRVIPVSDTETKNLLKEHRDISEEDIKKQAYKTWGNHTATHATVLPADFTLQDIDPANVATDQVVFYCRVRSRMIARRAIGYLKSADYEVLKNRESVYT